MTIQVPDSKALGAVQALCERADPYTWTAEVGEAMLQNISWHMEKCDFYGAMPKKFTPAMQNRYNKKLRRCERVKKASRRTLLVLSLIVLIIFSGCSGGSGAAPDPRIGFRYPDSADVSALDWTDAFKEAHDKFSHEYAFGDWKGVDWPGLSSRFLPRITQARAAGDEKAYYLALHEYVCSIPDVHISLSAGNAVVPAALGRELAGGGYGMAAAELDDWRVVAAAIVPNGPADLAGIVAGAEIITWGGQPARTAIDRIDVGAVPFKALTGAVGGESPQATREHYRLEQVRLLTRGPIGAGVQVGFQNPGALPRTKRKRAGWMFPNFLSLLLPNGCPIARSAQTSDTLQILQEIIVA